VTRIHQIDGSVQVYEHVHMQLDGETLTLSSPDKAGVLEIESGACSHIGEIRRCLPYMTTLHQHGKTHEIELEHGTVYVNLSGATQTMRHSSDVLAPHEVVVLLHTIRGTIVSVKGTLDASK